MRVGFGFDIHPLREGRELILGGVKIPFSKGLDGHSDADCLVHAICDALLGAIGKGDIGEHFPDTDERYHAISSLKLLEQVVLMVKDAGYEVGTIDTTIIADAPHLAPYKASMAETLSTIVHSNKERINIKASTTNGVSLFGKEGIAAYAVVCLEEQQDR